MPVDASFIMLVMTARALDNPQSLCSAVLPCLAHGLHPHKDMCLELQYVLWAFFQSFGIRTIVMATSGRAGLSLTTKSCYVLDGMC